jgi:hypothetical protein
MVATTYVPLPGSPIPTAAVRMLVMRLRLVPLGSGKITLNVIISDQTGELVVLLIVKLIARLSYRSFNGIPT